MVGLGSDFMSAVTRYWLRTRAQKIEDAMVWASLAFGLVAFVGVVYVFIHFAHKYW